MKRPISLLILLTLFVSTITAQQVSINEAMSRAKAFLKTSMPHRVPSAPGTLTPGTLTLAYTAQKASDQKVCFYVFNRSSESSAAKGTTNANDGNGFIIVGGDEAAQEILGYCDHGTFDYATAPDNFKWWLTQYQQQISAAIDYAEANPQAVKAAKDRAKIARKVASSSRTSVSPLLTTQWNQNTPYNDDVIAAFRAQTEYNVNLATGCVATAMAQVMYYHHINHDISSGTGSFAGTTRGYTVSGNQCSFTPSATFGEYDWDNMLTTYTTNNYTTVQGAAVAKLLYHAGVSVDMRYGNSSSASMSKIPNAFSTYFGYDKSVRYEERNYRTDTEWENMIYQELTTNGPVLYGGQNKNGNSGHCFIVDGYKSEDNTYHVNWGWGGYCDCYCLLTGTVTLKPGGSGIGGDGDNAEYSNGQEAVINVKKSSTNLETPYILNNTGKLVLINGNNELYEYEHTHGTSKTLTLKENLWNLSRSLTSFTIGVKATDTTTGYEYYFQYPSTCDLSITGYSDKQVSFDVNELPYNGTYEINMVARNNSSQDWYDVGVQHTVTKPTVTITNASEPTRQDVVFTINANTVQVSRTLQISHSPSYKGNITYESSDKTIAQVDENGVVTGISTGQATITATATGNTYFNQTVQQFNVNVTAFTKDDVEVVISATQLVVGQAAQITLTEGYDGTPDFSTNPTGIVSVDDDGTVTALAEGTTAITVTIPETERFNGTTKTFDVTVNSAGLIFTEAPYFSNDNNPWEEDLVLYIPLYNGSNETFSGNFYAKANIGNSTYILTMGMSNLGACQKYLYPLDLEELKDIMAIDAPKTISFYHNYDSGTRVLSIPFNIPSITYTYRSTLNYDYALTAAGIGTLILPFNADIPSGLEAYESNTAQGTTLVLTKATTLKRNTPYIIQGTPGTYNFKGPKAIDNSPTLFGTGLLKGTFLEDTYQFTTSDYILQNGKSGIAFYHYTSDSGEWHAAPYRAFLQDNTSSLTSSFLTIPNPESVPTTLSPASLSPASAGIYAPNGVKLQHLQKGLNIIVDEQGNTHKVFCK